ncbi:AAA family ATPase [Catellatospora bangladeshensis]|uniref:ATP-binding protein n=1 Tax=Catellatospora bangladeshensis TaxID=310355 RepID=UPI00360DE5BF
MGSQRGGVSSAMIGRDRELRQLTQLVAARRPAVVFVGGEPGIGKTRLVRELLTTLPEQAVALVGQAEPDSLARPYELLLDAVDGVDVPAGRLTALTDPQLSPVERLHSGLSLVADLSGEAPTVIVFEDLHWADSESAALFERLADTDGPRLLVGTYRPDEVSNRHPLASLLERMERRHAVTHLRLERLTESETAALLATVTGRPVPYRTAAALFHRTGGNPFFLEELLGSCAPGDLESLVEKPLPWSLAEVLRRQVASLDPAAQRVVEAAAVLGRRAPFDLLAEVTGAGEDELIGVLRDLVVRGVLVEAGEDEFSFRHALVREAITGQMLGRQRRRLHESALEALQRGGDADPALVAHHAQAAGRYADMVSAARRGALEYLAIGSAYQALQLAEMGMAEEPDDLVLLSAAARAAWLAGLLDDAAGYARRWRDLADGPADRADALYLLIRLSWEADDLPWLERVTADLEQLIAELPPGADQARAMTAVAQSAMLRDYDDESLAWADRALALAAEFDLPQIRLAALVEKGTVLTGYSERAVEGRAILSGLVAEAERRGEWVLAARALNRLLHMPQTSSLTEQAELLERMRRDAERAGFEALAVAAYYQGRARLAMREGDLRAAIGALDDGRAATAATTTRAAVPTTTRCSWPGCAWSPARWTGCADCWPTSAGSRRSTRWCCTASASTWPAATATSPPPTRCWTGSWTPCAPSPGAAASRPTTCCPPRCTSGCRCPGSSSCPRRCSTARSGTTGAPWSKPRSPRYAAGPPRRSTATVPSRGHPARPGRQRHGPPRRGPLPARPGPRRRSRRPGEPGR